jgi:hypothetical protein
MSTRINVTVGDGGLLDRNAQQTAANRQARVLADQRATAEAEGVERRAADRTAAGLDPLTGLPASTPSSASTINRLNQEPAATRRPPARRVEFLPRKEDGIFKFDSVGYGVPTDMEIINVPSDTQLSIERGGPAGDYFRYRRTSSGASAGQLGLWFKLENSKFNLDSYKPADPASTGIRGFTWEFWYRMDSAPGAFNNIWGLGLRGAGTPSGAAGFTFGPGPQGFYISCRQTDDANGRKDNLFLNVPFTPGVEDLTTLEYVNLVPTPVWSHIRVVVNGEFVSWSLNGSLLETHQRQPFDDFDMTGIRGFTFNGGRATTTSTSSINIADNHFQLVRAYPFPLKIDNFTPPTDGFTARLP